VPTALPASQSHRDWVASKHVQVAVERALRHRGFRGADLEDERQNVLERALAAGGPDGLEECLALVRKIARDRAFDVFRQRGVRARFGRGKKDDPEEVSEGVVVFDERLVDVRRQLDSVRRDIARGSITPRQARILAAEMEGVPRTAIAAEHGIDERIVRRELSVARQRMRVSFAAYTVLAVVAFVLAAWFARDRAPAVPRYLPDRGAPHVQPAPAPTVPADRVDARVREQREVPPQADAKTAPAPSKR
jgi:DNA-directed RNA polymerase specialized sigma24 family protein